MHDTLFFFFARDPPIVRTFTHTRKKQGGGGAGHGACPFIFLLILQLEKNGEPAENIGSRVKALQLLKNDCRQPVYHRVSVRTTSATTTAEQEGWESVVTHRPRRRSPPFAFLGQYIYNPYIVQKIEASSSSFYIDPPQQQQHSHFDQIRPTSAVSSFFLLLLLLHQDLPSITNDDHIHAVVKRQKKREKKTSRRQQSDNKICA